MTNCIFYSLFFVLFLNVSFGSLRFSQINRTFMNMYKGMLEASVITVDANGESCLPYYDIERVNSYLNNYLNKNIAKFTKGYTISTTLTNRNSTDLCYSNCSSLNVRLTAKINQFYKYDKVQVFTVYSEDEV